MSLFFKTRDANIYVSNDPAGPWDSSNTVKIFTTGFSYNRPDTFIKYPTSTSDLDPNKDRSLSPTKESWSFGTFQFTTHLSYFNPGSIWSAQDYLWQGLAGTTNGRVQNGTELSYTFGSNSDIAQLNELHIFIEYEDDPYKRHELENCVIDSATINFDINKITTVTWRGRCKFLGMYTGSGPSSVTTFEEVFNQVCLFNKYAVTTLKWDYENPSTYSFGESLTGITAGSITFRNNNTYIMKKELNEYDTPNTHYTGSRDITGFLKYYLTGGADGSSYWNTILSAGTTHQSINIDIQGPPKTGTGVNNPRFIIDIPRSIIEVGTIATSDQLPQLSIPFTAAEISGEEVKISYEQN